MRIIGTSSFGYNQKTQSPKSNTQNSNPHFGIVKIIKSLNREANPEFAQTCSDYVDFLVHQSELNELIRNNKNPRLGYKNIYLVANVKPKQPDSLKISVGGKCLYDLKASKDESPQVMGGQAADIAWEIRTLNIRDLLSRQRG